MNGIGSLEKSTIHERFSNYITEKNSIEEQLQKPTVVDEYRGRLQFRKKIVQREVAQLSAINAIL